MGTPFIPVIARRGTSDINHIRRKTSVKGLPVAEAQVRGVRPSRCPEPRLHWSWRRWERTRLRSNAVLPMKLISGLGLEFDQSLASSVISHSRQVWVAIEGAGR